MNNTKVDLQNLNQIGEVPASKLPIITDKAIDPLAIVSCPRFEFSATKAADFCPTCPHFGGLGVMNPGPGVRFDKAYAVRCGYPIERRTVIINTVNKG